MGESEGEYLCQCTSARWHVLRLAVSSNYQAVDIVGIGRPRLHSPYVALANHIRFLSLNLPYHVDVVLFPSYCDKSAPDAADSPVTHSPMFLQQWQTYLTF